MDSLKKQAHALSPIVSVGKSGLTRGVLEQIIVELKARHLIKIKLMKNSFANREEKKKLVQKLVAETGAELISQVGGTVVLHK